MWHNSKAGSLHHTGTVEHDIGLKGRGPVSLYCYIYLQWSEVSVVFTSSEKFARYELLRRNYYDDDYYDSVTVTRNSPTPSDVSNCPQFVTMTTGDVTQCTTFSIHKDSSVLQRDTL